MVNREQGSSAFTSPRGSPEAPSGGRHGGAAPGSAHRRRLVGGTPGGALNNGGVDDTIKEEETEQDPELNEAATKLQTAHRGKIE